MKIKDDIIKWREEIRQLNTKVAKFEANAKNIYEDITEVKQQVAALVKITEEMTETLLTLIRQQIGD